MVTRCVLVVDDDQQIRELAAASLGLVGGWEVLSAGSGAEGVALAASRQPDAILLDSMMPGMDGRATLATLRAGPATGHIPVVMLTAEAGPGGAAFVPDLPVAAVIAKPFEIMGLADRVAAALGWDR